MAERWLLPLLSGSLDGAASHLSALLSGSLDGAASHLSAQLCHR